MGQDAFRTALVPVLTDLGRDLPGLLRVEELPDDPILHAYLWDNTGAGTGLYLSDAYDGAELIADAADQVQEVAIEALWREERPTNWPPCPWHPDSHPLSPAQWAGSAVWRCPATGEPAGKIGFLIRT